MVLKVTATDNGIPALNSTVDVYVEILDYNDNSPHFTEKDYRFSVPENVSVGHEVYQINATDADVGPNANITFSIESGGENFTIDVFSVCQPNSFHDLFMYNLFGDEIF